MKHPDFRVSGKVFATLGYPDRSWGMVKLTQEQQAAFVMAEPEVFVPASGAWGRRGATSVYLRAVRSRTLRAALESAWANTAPKRLTAVSQGRI